MKTAMQAIRQSIEQRECVELPHSPALEKGLASVAKVRIDHPDAIYFTGSYSGRDWSVLLEVPC